MPMSKQTPILALSFIWSFQNAKIGMIARRMSVKAEQAIRDRISDTTQMKYFNGTVISYRQPSMSIQ